MPFSRETLDFLVENRLRDSRAWFGEHKAEYQKWVIQPLKEMVEALTPHMLAIDDQFVTQPRVDKTISRIWRDTRYTHDPSLYRDSMWIIFKRGRMHATEVPGIYFDLGPYGFSYGCGFYHASTGYMNTLRQMILRDDPAFKKAQAAYARQRIFAMEGECYKRPHYSDQPGEKALWLERRNIGFSKESRDFDLLYSDRLAQVVADDLAMLSPVYRFLLAAAQEENMRDVGHAALEAEK